MEDVVDAFKAVFEPARSDVESIPCIATGKTVRQGFRPPDDPSSSQSRPQSAIDNGPPRRTPSGLIGSGGATIPPRPSRVPSAPAPTGSLSPGATQSSRSSISSSVASPSRDHLTPTDFTTASRLGQTAAQAAGRPVTSAALRPPTESQDNYFSRRASTSTTATAVSLGATNSAGTGLATPLSNVTNSSAAAAAIASKKKPPPPPPPKKGAHLRKPVEFVVAQYAFDNGQEGDLTFSAGDRIRIIQKTDTDQDWWLGELKGVKGNFPANYCQPEK